MLGSWMPFGLVVLAAQATLMFAAIKFGLGFEMAHPWLVWLFLCYVALVFTGFIHGLTVILGAPDAFVALVILILQLITAGGTMPYETLPESIRWMLISSRWAVRWRVRVVWRMALMSRVCGASCWF